MAIEAEDTEQLKEGSYRFRSESRGDLIIPKRPSRGCSGFSYIGPKLWNKMSKGLRETYDPGPFRRQLKHTVCKKLEVRSLAP